MTSSGDTFTLAFGERMTQQADPAIHKFSPSGPSSSQEPSSLNIEIRSSKRKRSPTTTRPTGRKGDEDQESSGEDDDEEDPLYEESKTSKKPRKSTQRKAPATSKRANSDDEVEKLKLEIKELNKQSRELKSENQKLHKSLKSVTTESILNARKGSKELWDLDKMRTILKGLSKEIKNWVKKHGISKTVACLDAASKEAILSSCSNATVIPFDIFAENDFRAIQDLPRGAQLLLEGYLYAHASYYLIKRPFIFLDEGLENHDSRPKQDLLKIGFFEKNFELFAAELEKNDSYLGQKWTASMLQSLKPIIIPDFPSNETQRRREEERRSNEFFKKYETEISALAGVFLRSPPVKVLLSPTTPKRKDQHKELKRIFCKFRELAYHMWCQPSTVKVGYYNKNQDGSLGLIGFDPSTMELDASATNSRQDEPERLIGDRVLINLSPAIIGCMVDSDNETLSEITYTKQKVWTAGCQTVRRWQISLKENCKISTQNEASQNNSVPQNAPGVPSNDEQYISFLSNHDQADFDRVFPPHEMNCGPAREGNDNTPDAEQEKDDAPRNLLRSVQYNNPMDHIPPDDIMVLVPSFQKQDYCR